MRVGRIRVSGLGEGQLPLVARGYLRDQEGRRLPSTIRQDSTNQVHQQGDERCPRGPQGVILKMVVLKVS